jgi:carbamoyltransferase
MRYCGISEFFHDAGIAFITEHGDIEFAAHSERYSKIKNDPDLNIKLINMIDAKDHVSYYELKDHQREFNFRTKNLDRVANPPIHNSLVCNSWVNHHISHAAGAFYTRPWADKNNTVILTIDGAGEQQTMGIYDHKFNLLENEYMPRSIGMFYSWVTKFLGLRPLEDEYVVMGLASYGEPLLVNQFHDLYKSNLTKGNIKNGIIKICKNMKDEDIAASIQKFTEEKIIKYANIARRYGTKLLYSGGVAQNIVANSLIKPLFDDMWIPTAPSDSGSALGCAAHSYGRITGNDRINWEGPYLGYNIKREINPKKVVDHLLEHTYCGIANGRAEFGPRALGNRSLIADVRYDVKDTVNKIKRRQKYRPFAPAILEEFVDQYFEGPVNEYMQYTSKALHDYKSVTHVDGTARVQVVKKDCKSVIRPILEEYYERTGVPMLLNTSLNIRGMPMVNDEKDAEAWERKYKVKVF